MSLLRPALVIFGSFTVITGLLYPLGITGLTNTLFHAKAQGSLLRVDGQVIGSRLIGQPQEDPRSFWSRLSATGDNPYNASNSGGSNLSEGNPTLRSAAQTRIAALMALDPGNTALVPVDLITASASGLDPHISPAAADYQVPRVARLRGLDPQIVKALVQKHTQSRSLGFIGEPCVNVLELNLELDAKTK